MSNPSNKKNTIFFVTLFFLTILITPTVTKADVLLPGNINTCGEIAVAGEYTLTGDISSGTSTCLTISSDNVIINGGGYSILGTSTTAIDGRVGTEGADSYTNLVINDLTITPTFTVGVNLSGSNSTSDYGGDGGDVDIYYSRIGSIITSGGNSTVYPSGGLGGNIMFTSTDLNIASSTIWTLGGTGISSRNTDGGLDLNYTGTLNRDNIILSSLAYFNDNATQYGIYSGGTWPMTPGNITTCGTLYGPGTFTLTQDIISTSTCFTIASNNVTIVGAGFSLISSTSTNSNYAINASTFSSTTIDNLTFTNFPNIITSSSSVIIKGNNLNLSTKKINSPNITIDAGTLNLATTTFITDLLDINYSVSIAGTSTATSTALTNLRVNNLDYGPRVAGLIFNPAWIARMTDTNRSWKSIASSVDGKKMVAVVENGNIFTSINGGMTWATSTNAGVQTWKSVASSADGMKIVAVPTNGQIYVSIDGGNTWTTREFVRSWNSVASSLDGSKLVASVSTGLIYTSSDGGVTWLARMGDVNRTWNSVTSSADGTKLFAVASGTSGYIYISTDSGVTWATSTGSLSLGTKTWYSISSSAEGDKLVAVVFGGYIYTSNDSGNTWATSTGSISLGVKNWYFTTMSLDGSKFIAGIDYGSLYTSSNNGLTLDTAIIGSLYWRGATLSPDGNKITVVRSSSYINTNTTFQPSLSVNILSPRTNDNFSIWNPIISWGISKNCYYSYDNFISTSTVNCSLNGSDVLPPSGESITLYVKGISNTGEVIIKSVNFTNGSNQNIQFNLPTLNTSYEATTWFPNVDYSTSDVTLVTCEYSYNNFATTSTADCSLNGSDILPPSDGNATLYVRTIDAENNTNISSITFSYIASLYTYMSSGLQYWSSLAVSNDGSRMIAMSGRDSGSNYYGRIYTSDNSGTTWTAREIVTHWSSLAPAFDAVKLAVIGGSWIYTSIDSGVTWVQRTSAGGRSWKSIASDTTGDKLAAVVSNGYIYTSSNSGETWATSTSSGIRSWTSITSNISGTKLAAAVYTGHIYTSSDSGITWATSSSGIGTRDWNFITSDASGTKLAASAYNNYIYISNNSGATWSTSTSAGVKTWKEIKYSADGTKLAATTADNEKIYISLDNGITWINRGNNGYIWKLLGFNPQGNRLFASASGSSYTDYIKVIDFAFDIYVNLYVNINIPASGSFLSSQTWSPDISWGFNKTTCQYSYNNFASTSNADCSLGGSDILPPQTGGSNTLYVRSMDLANNMSSANSIFNYVLNGWVESNSTQGYWYYLASNVSGQKILATASQGGTVSDYLYRSTDFGATWERVLSAGIRGWQAVASDATGERLFVSVYNGPTYTSTDGGANWTQRGPYSAKYWSAIASSADGLKLFAAYGSGYIHISSDGGLTWATSTASLGTKSWNSITVSADGNKIAATSGGLATNGHIYTSTDGGATWATSTTAGQRYWQTISSSADGTRLVAAVGSGSGGMYYGYIYTSIDSGATWVQRSTDGSATHDWQSVSSSADGTKISATMSSGQIYTSIDGGATWTQGTFKSSEGWGGMTSSADGNRFFAGGSHGYIKTMVLNPQTLATDILLPQPTNIISAWNPIISWSTAVSCYYSYDNWNSTSTANCSLNGADLNSPTTAGVSTLSIMAVDPQGNTDTASSTFTYAPYFFCGTVDSNWTTVGNWYSDNTCTTLMGSIPGASHGAILLGSVAPTVNSTTTLPIVINSTGLTGGANTTGIIFESGSYNTTRIIGNATFNNTGYNIGNITGNAVFNSATAGTLTLNNTMKWGGTVSGSIKGNDGQDITHLIFNDSSSNQTTIDNNITTVFNNGASNLGTINGNVTFNNTGLFSMGTVNGTATLNGLSQTLTGINSVINFFKQAISRDTLFLSSGSTLNISGLATILGLDANNLLTLRSTNPGQVANLNLNGTNNLDYLRIKDISNTGNNLDLQLKTVFDDGNNFGFTFKASSSPSNRGGSTGSYDIPYVPVSHGGTLPPVTPPSTPDPDVDNTVRNVEVKRNTTTYSGTIDLRINPNFKPIDFNRLPPVNLFGRDIRDKIRRGGETQLPSLFNELKVPEVLSFTQTPARFLTNVFNFITGLGQGSTKAKNITDDTYMKELGIDINNEQNLARLHLTPVKVTTDILNNNTILSTVKSGKSTLTTYLTYSNELKSLAQLVKVTPGQNLTITNTTSSKPLNYKAPNKSGQYIVTQEDGNVPLIVEVLETQKVEVKKGGFWAWFWGLFR